MASRKDRKCRHCPALVYRDSVTGLCAPCLTKERQLSSPLKERKCRHCPALIGRDSITGLCSPCLIKERHSQQPSAQVLADREKVKLRENLAQIQRKYGVAMKDVERLEGELGIVQSLSRAVETITIEPKSAGHSTNEGTVIVPAHDWHVEERVDLRVVSGLNEFNLDIAKARAAKFFQGALRLTRLVQQDIPVNNMVLPLLGDFISNDIHEEFPEICMLPPMEAIRYAQSLLISGFEFLLANSKLTFTVPCHSGNHARTTKTTRFSTENGHSIEYLMYHALATYFRTEPRITFQIAEGPHSYLDVYGKRFRLHHGHMIKYQGGIGGIFIPTFKAIAQWNKAKAVDYDLFGHFHQRKNGGNFQSGASLIGYNAFALSIKADYEMPSQNFILVDKKRGVTCEWPIILETR